MTTVTDRISASGHDAYDTDSGFPGFSATATGEFKFGDNTAPSRIQYMGLIWDGVSIPSGATYDSGCDIDLTDVSFGSGGAAEMDVYGVEEKTLTVWAAGDMASRTRTTATTNWSSNWLSGAVFTSPELNTIFQEIEDDATGSGVTDLTVVLEDTNAGVQNRDVEAFDGTAGEAAFVTIEYTAGGGGANTRRYSLTTTGVG